MKKIDYYAMNQPWKMPKWVGYTLGGVFGIIALGSGVGIIALTRPAPAAVAAAPAITAPAPAVQVAAAEPQDEAPAAAPAAHEKASRGGHHKSAKKHDKHAKPTRLASSRPAPMSDGKASAILAKHDSRSKRKDKDALDKLLGL